MSNMTFFFLYFFFFFCRFCPFFSVRFCLFLSVSVPFCPFLSGLSASVFFLLLYLGIFRVSVQLLAYIKRFSVSHMRDFFSLYNTLLCKLNKWKKICKEFFSITFPKVFWITGHWTLGSGGKKTIKRSEKVWQKDKHKHTNICTFQLHFRGPILWKYMTFKTLK